MKAAILVYSGTQGIALVDEVTEFFRKDADQFILKLGLVYFTAIGQGIEYHHGFYGPLPIPSIKDHLSFVFTTTVPSRRQHDDRTNGESYVLTCLICPKQKIPTHIDWPAIEATFQAVFREISDAGEIDASTANAMKKAFLNGSE
ncbi:MAG: hypothetical protein ACXAEI_09965 [Candidatus Hodarchaeales archaeon]|jgi:hypothetical protein